MLPVHPSKIFAFPCSLVVRQQEQKVCVRIVDTIPAISITSIGNKKRSSQEQKKIIIPIKNIEDISICTTHVLRKKKGRMKHCTREVLALHTSKDPLVFSTERVNDLKIFFTEALNYYNFKVEDINHDLKEQINNEITPPVPPEHKIKLNENPIPQEGLTSSTVLHAPPNAIINRIMRENILINALKQMGCIIQSEKYENGILYLTHTVLTGLPFPKNIICSQVITSSLSPEYTIKAHVTSSGHKWTSWMDAEWMFLLKQNAGETTLYLYYWSISKAGKSIKFLNKPVKEFVINATDHVVRYLRSDSDKLNLVLYNYNGNGYTFPPNIDCKDKETEITVEKFDTILKNKKTQTYFDPEEHLEENNKSIICNNFVIIAIIIASISNIIIIIIISSGKEAKSS